MADLVRHPQHMGIMNVVWPVTALYGTALALWGYFRYGREPRDTKQTPVAASVGKAALHCGSGCTVGDIIAEWLVFAVPGVAIAFGWQRLFAEKMFAVWIVDYLFAFAFGILFQYLSIKPMRNLTVGQGIVEAVKADALSLTAWQVGMYGFMAIAQFAIFRPLFGVRLDAASFEFWFMMQIAMLAGFLTSYPVNWWLVRSGIKGGM